MAVSHHIAKDDHRQKMVIVSITLRYDQIETQEEVYTFWVLSVCINSSFAAI